MRNARYLDDLLEHFTAIGPPGCGLQVSLHGKVVYERYQGLRDRERGAPIQRDTVYRVYSSTKVITVACAMILYERGKFLLDDPVSRYLPGFDKPKYFACNGAGDVRITDASRPIAMRHLMNMTCGIPYGGADNRTQREIAQIGAAGSRTLQEFVRALSAVPLCFDPGTRWMYGYGVDVLGAVVEVLADQSLGAFMRDELFSKLGMDDTGFFLTGAMRPRLAALYAVGDGGIAREAGRDGGFEPGSLFESGGAGLLSTLGDMSRFSQMMAMGGALDGVRMLSPGTVDLMRMDHLGGQAKADFERACRQVWPNMRGYSFGLGCRTMVDRALGGSNGSLGEFAWSGAAGTYTLIDPARRLSVEYAHQLFPSGKNMQDYCHPRIRNAVYAAIDD